MNRPALNSPTIPANHYTDTPPLKHRPLPAFWQMLGWIFFHPTAWANHLLSIHPALSPNFCLVEISGTQWKKPALRRLLVNLYLPAFLFLLLIISLVLLVAGIPAAAAIRITLTSLFTAAIFALSFAALVSVSSGLMMGLSIGIASIFFPLNTPWFPLTTAIACGLAGASQIVHNRLSSPIKIPGLLMGLAASGLVVFGILWLINLIASSRLARQIWPTAVINNQPLMTSIGLGVILSCLALIVLSRRTHYRLYWQIIFALFCGAIFSWGFYQVRLSPNSFVLINIYGSLANALRTAVMYSLIYLLVNKISGPKAAPAISSLAVSLNWVSTIPLAIPAYQPPPSIHWVVLAAWFIAISSSIWHSILIYPFDSFYNLVLLRLDQAARKGPLTYFHRHTLFWQETQFLPWPGLDEHLLLVAERQPEMLAALMEFAARRNQAWAIRRMVVELTARQMGQCRDLAAIGQVHTTLMTGSLSNISNALLQQLGEVSRDIDTALSQVSVIHSRSLLGEARNQLHRLHSDLMVSNMKDAARFIPITSHWLRILTKALDDLSTGSGADNSLPNPYICGNPLDAHQTVFVGRVDTISRIEQFLMDERHAPILLYGQRRMGKSSLLLNLERILPSAIIPAYVDSQACAAAEDYAEFMFMIFQQIRRGAERQRGFQLPALEFNALAERPAIVLPEYIHELENLLEKSQKHLLICLDEIEALNPLFNRPGFPYEYFFTTLRHTMQHQPRFKLILAGSHTFDELQHWSSYLINAQLIKIGYLDDAETRQLIEHPVSDFPLRYQPQAVQRIFDLTRAQPNLVQVICYELITLKNNQSVSTRYLVTTADVDNAAAVSLETGTFFFVDYRRQVLPAALPMLHHLAQQGAGGSLTAADWRSDYPDNFDRHLSNLLQRDIVEPWGNGYRFQIELVRQWFQAHPPAAG